MNVSLLNLQLESALELRALILVSTDTGNFLHVCHSLLIAQGHLVMAFGDDFGVALCSVSRASRKYRYLKDNTFKRYTKLGTYRELNSPARAGTGVAYVNN